MSGPLTCGVKKRLKKEALDMDKIKIDSFFTLWVFRSLFKLFRPVWSGPRHANKS